jgi:hypothetical protein
MTDETDNTDLEPPTKGPAGIGAVAAFSALKKPEVAKAAKWIGVGVGIGSAALAAALIYNRQRGKADDSKS